MQYTVPIICAIATFVLITDHLRTVQAQDDVEPPKQKYTTQYDNFDVERVLRSERLLKNYIKCLKNKGPCTKEGKELKVHLPDALKTDCSKCSETQKKQAGKVLTFILQNHRDDWNELVQIYDPEGIFREKYGYEEEEDGELDEARRR